MFLYPTLLLKQCPKVTLACFFFFTSPSFQGCEEVFSTFCCLHPMLIDNLGIFCFNHIMYNSQKCRGLELSSVFSPTAFLLWRTPDFYVVPLCNLQDLWSWRRSSIVLKDLKATPGQVLNLWEKFQSPQGFFFIVSTPVLGVSKLFFPVTGQICHLMDRCPREDSSSTGNAETPNSSLSSCRVTDGASAAGHISAKLTQVIFPSQIQPFWSSFPTHT